MPPQCLGNDSPTYIPTPVRGWSPDSFETVGDRFAFVIDDDTNLDRCAV